jgi:hypothetical protein
MRRAQRSKDRPGFSVISSTDPTNSTNPRNSTNPTNPTSPMDESENFGIDICQLPLYNGN